MTAIPAAMVVATRFSGNLFHRLGSSVMTGWAMSAFSLSALVVGYAQNLPELVIALAILGLALGATDTAMNAHAITVNGLYDRSIISSFHGYYNVGATIGGLIGAAT
jgi:MFS family permease